MSDRFVGQIFGDYRLTAVLGQGELGIVYHALHTHSQKPVAIKVLHAHLTRSEDFVQRFLSEETMAKRLHHPALLSVYAFGQTDTRHYIVMEAAAGPTLRQTMTDLRKTGHWFLLSESIQIAHQICHAVDYVRRLKGRPRAVWPEKIVLKAADRDDLPCQPLLLDLGLTTLLYADPLTHLRQNPQSAPFLAPETQKRQVNNEQTAVYALGVLLYELLCGQLPPSGGLDVTALHALYPDLPEPLSKLLARALSPTPTARFANAGELAAELITTLRVAQTVQTAPNDLSAVAIATYLQQSGENAPVAVPSVSHLSTPLASSSISAELDPVSPVAMVVEKSAPEIVIRGPDGTTQRRILTQSTLTIGREPLNDIVLPDRKVSREHVRLTVENMRCKVEDLGSSNGTYLDSVRVPVNTPTPWLDGSAMQIGRYELQMVQPATAALPLSKQGYVAVNLSHQELWLEPNKEHVLTLSLLNQGPLEDNFDITVAGISATWVTLPEKVRLHTGEQKTTQLVFQVAPSPTIPAGRYPVAISVHSVAEPDQTTVVQMTLVVVPYYHFKSALEFTKLRTGSTTYLHIENRGNALQTFDLAWQDQGGELDFAHPPLPIPIVPGETVKVAFRAATKHRHLWGKHPPYHITVTVTSREQTAGQPETLPATVESAPLIPGWAPWAGVVAAVVTVWAWTTYLLLDIKSLTVSPTLLVERTLYVFHGEIGGWVNQIAVNGLVVTPVAPCRGRSLCAFEYRAPAPPYSASPLALSVVVRGPIATAAAQITVVFATLTPTSIPATPTPPTSQVQSFTANRTRFTVGSTAELCFDYMVQDAVAVAIKPAPGPLDKTDSGAVCLSLPDKTTTYILEATNAAGEVARTEQTIDLVPPLVSVDSAANLRSGPGTTYEIVRPLTVGMRLLALAHPANFTGNAGDGNWLYVKVAESGQLGWVEASLVTPAADVTLDELPDPPQPAPSPTPVPSATATLTPVPTPTAPPAIFVSVNPKIIESGECVTVRWNIQKVKSVYLNGQPVTGTQKDEHSDMEAKPCLTETTTFTWEIEFPDGTKTKREETVVVTK